MISPSRERHRNETKLGTLLVRFSLAFLAVFALLLGGAYLFQNHFIKSSYLQVRDLALLTENLDLLEKALVEQESGQRGYSMTGEQSFLDAYSRGTADYEQLVQNLRDRAFLTPLFETAIESLLADIQRWESRHLRALFDQSLLGRSASATQLKIDEAAFLELSAEFDDVLSRIVVQRDLERERLLKRISLTLALAGTAALLALGLYVFFIIKHIRRLIDPLAALDRAISFYEGSRCELERNDYTSSGELGRLVGAFNRMGEDMRRESEQLEDTYKMINALNQAASLQDVYRETLVHMRALVQCDKVSLIMQNADRRFYFKTVLQGEHLKPKEALLPGEQEQLRELIRGGVSVLHEDWDMRRPLGELADRLYGSGIRSSVQLLLRKDKRIVGVLNLMSAQPFFFTAVKKQRLEKLVPLIVTSIENVRQTGQIQSLAMRDGLTGLWNRRYFEDSLVKLHNETFPKHNPNAHPLSLILLDVDHFKRLNDTRGHQEGDTVLKHIGLLLRAYSRFGDLPVRFGGEEFAVLLPDTPIEEAADVAERLRRLIEFDSPSPDYVVTASFGVAELQARQNAQELIRTADSALYRAKAAGRNRVCIHGEDLNDSA